MTNLFKVSANGQLEIDFEVLEQLTSKEFVQALKAEMEVLRNKAAVDIMSAAYKAGSEFSAVLGPAEEWSNNSCLGYAIRGAEVLGFTEGQTEKLVRAIRGEFDWVSLEDAKRIYNTSPY